MGLMAPSFASQEHSYASQSASASHGESDHPLTSASPGTILHNAAQQNVRTESLNFDNENDQSQPHRRNNYARSGHYTEEVVTSATAAEDAMSEDPQTKSDDLESSRTMRLPDSPGAIEDASFRRIMDSLPLVFERASGLHPLEVSRSTCTLPLKLMDDVKDM